MEPCIVLRGPAGVGKTTVAQELQREVGGDYYSLDAILKAHGLDTIVGDGIPTAHFIKAQNIILSGLATDRIVILDGCFYREEQLNHLKEKLARPLYIFTLHAALEECQRRNSQRSEPLSSQAVDDVYSLMRKRPDAIPIDTTHKSARQVLEQIMAHLRQ